jgi:hypothetical protein
MAVAEKLDLYKKHKVEYAAPKKPVLVSIAPASHLTISGKGEPGGEAFTAAIGALYAVAFTIKMAKKFAGQDYAVCKLEALWPPEVFRLPRNEWTWKLLIRVPSFITERDRSAALNTLRERGKEGQSERVQLESIEEGRCVQMLHIGPYDREAETIAAMMDFARGQGLKPHAAHHEVYLSDPRRVEPARLRTILRQPVR